MPNSSAQILVYSRPTGQLFPERVLGDRLIRLAYHPWGHALLGWPLFGWRLISRLLGVYADSRWSRHRIRRTVQELGVELDDFVVPDAGYRSFNDFFTRKIKSACRPFDASPETLCSPADCRLLAWQTCTDLQDIPVKGGRLPLCELLGDAAQEVVPHLAGGPLLVCRLCPSDYHRFHFPASGSCTADWSLPGRMDSVNPVALRTGRASLVRNQRWVSMLELERFGLAAYVEVGAFGVGKIVQTYTGPAFTKMDEKGYFAFGGSTIVLAFAPMSVDLDPDLLANTATGYETWVGVGEHIGVARA